MLMPWQVWHPGLSTTWCNTFAHVVRPALNHTSRPTVRCTSPRRRAGSPCRISQRRQDIGWGRDSCPRCIFDPNLSSSFIAWPTAEHEENRWVVFLCIVLNLPILCFCSPCLLAPIHLALLGLFTMISVNVVSCDIFVDLHIDELPPISAVLASLTPTGWISELPTSCPATSSLYTVVRPSWLLHFVIDRLPHLRLLQLYMDNAQHCTRQSPNRTCFDTCTSLLQVVSVMLQALGWDL